jgi:cell division protein FtsA
MAGCRISTVYAGVAGSHVRALNKEGVAAIPNREVVADDVTVLIEMKESKESPWSR